MPGVHRHAKVGGFGRWVASKKEVGAMPRKAAPAPVGDRRYRQAVELFEKAVKAFGRKDFERTRTYLNTLIETHDDQPDLVERARSYLAMCDRAGGKKAPRPRTFEEMLNSEDEYAPGVDKLTMDSPPPLQSDADGNYPIPMPGIRTQTEY